MKSKLESFTVLTPPPDIRRFRTDAIVAPQRIDYAAHPAYREFTRGRPLAVRVTATTRFLKSLVPLAAKRLINYELIPNEVRLQRGGVSGRLRFVAASLVNMKPRRRRVGGAKSRLAQTLGADGCLVLAAPPEALAAVQVASAGAFAKLEQARAARANAKRQFEESRFHANRREEQDLFTAVEDLLREAGVLEAASGHLGREARLVDVNPQINDPSDSFWRDVFPDMDGKTLPNAAYFHRDASGGDLKAIIYMSDVTPVTGPFSYVLGSHRCRISRLDDFICEANDHNGLAHTDPGSRRHFAALPKIFQQKGAFGNDLLDDQPASQEIGKAAWSITGPNGSVVLFDTKGIHRGGMVEQGERRVITCVLG